MKIRWITLGKLLILSFFFFFFTQEKSSRSGTDARLTSRKSFRLTVVGEYLKRCNTDCRNRRQAVAQVGCSSEREIVEALFETFSGTGGDVDKRVVVGDAATGNRPSAFGVPIPSYPIQTLT